MKEAAKDDGSVAFIAVGEGEKVKTAMGAREG